MMKRFVLVILCLLTLSSAMAETQEEWNLSCNWKTTASATVYDMRTDEPTPIGTVPSGAYIRVHDRGKDGWMSVSWMDGSGVHRGWCQVSVARCSSSVRRSDGMADNVHELDPNHDKIIFSHEVIDLADSLLLAGADYSGVDFEEVEDPSGYALAYRGAVLSGRGTEIPVVQPGGALETFGDQFDYLEEAYRQQQGTADSHVPAATESTRERASSSSSARKSTSSRKTAQATPEPVQSGESTVTLHRVGTFLCEVKLDGETMTVPTLSLQYGSAPEEKRLAVIWAPRTGKASLRASASSSADVIKQCKAGYLVAVMEVGRKFTRVSYQGVTGWVLTDALRFHAPQDASNRQTALLAYKGRATGGTTINIRLEADGRKIAEFRTGTEVCVLESGHTWTHIEVDGYRGWVKNEFLLLPQ